MRVLLNDELVGGRHFGYFPFAIYAKFFFMKYLFSRRSVSLFLLLLFSVTLTSVVEARPGGGRSMGFRGSRGFGTSATPSRSQGRQPQQPNGFSQPAPRPPGGFGSSGGFMQGM